MSNLRQLMKCCVVFLFLLNCAPGYMERDMHVLLPFMHPSQGFDIDFLLKVRHSIYKHC